MIAGLAVLPLIAALLVGPTAQPRADPGIPATWGDNRHGQLGDGTTAGRNVPGQVCAGTTCPGPLAGVTAVEAGHTHTLALLDDGTVLAWGDNGGGRLGDGTATDRPHPTRVCAVSATTPCTTALARVRAISAGGSHSLAVLADGTVAAWGDNTYGQLGDGTTTSRNTPVRVCAVVTSGPCATFLSGVAAVAASDTHSLALLTDGTVVSWGDNTYGRLGDGTDTIRTTPVPVCALSTGTPCAAYLTGVTRVDSDGNDSLALLADGTIAAWGDNFQGQLGDGTVTERRTPVRVCAVGTVAPCDRYLTGVTAIAAGVIHNLAVADGGVVGWGANPGGQLGDGTTHYPATPVRTCAVGATAPCDRFLTGATAVSASGGSLAIADGMALSWGQNSLGELGDGTNTAHLSPTRVCAVGESAPCARFLTGVLAISAGDGHAVALTGRPAADLSVSLTADVAAEPSTVTYTVVVTNAGPSPATNGEVTLRLSHTARATTAPDCAQEARLVRCPLPPLDVGASVTRAVTVTLDPLAVAVPLTATATLAGGEPADPEPANDSATVDCLAATYLILDCPAPAPARMP
ncbi:hypothetical protein Lfu02_41960 [Longispora fulva]|uniref:Alpha-tubulin suppressor-like RCC1 family protein n=1 Tax=Longispora fulva TaxID=619741 RepID=A0A8J7GG25_9ACTN|nr:DUF11 domain-containing protein [Longispora fulva]MBG6136655.1 alpha-tubulin suppressor-like RCC1 family protein [Longispora fulva]GIG59824.1 hypothetical protein Lfu02_41960 [Longispora fulva]